MAKDNKKNADKTTNKAPGAPVAKTEAPAKTKRDIILESILAGGATMDSLVKAADCKYASVMSNFSMLRLMGKCPVKDVPTKVKDSEGKDVEILTYRIVSPEEWETVKAEAAERAATKTTVAKTPEEQLAALTARVERTGKAVEGTKKRADDKPESKILALRLQAAVIASEIANLELTEFKAKQ